MTRDEASEALKAGKLLRWPDRIHTTFLSGQHHPSNGAPMVHSQCPIAGCCDQRIELDPFLCGMIDAGLLDGSTAEAWPN